MALPILNLVILALLYFPIRLALRWRANIKLARASGLPYVILPVHIFDVPWIVSSQLLLPLARRVLPQSWQGVRLDVMDPEWSWQRRYLPFGNGPRGIGADTFLMVAPNKISLMTADAAVINQITTRRNDFPKPTALYKGIDIYGKNVVSTEGAVWRRHRKNTVPPFGEKNNRLVWSESIFQTQEMINHWRVQSQDVANSLTDKPQRSATSLLKEIGHDTMRFSLFVISRAGFDVRCDWPERSADSAADSVGAGAMSSTYIPTGFSLSYVAALESLLLALILLIMLPTWLLGYVPIKFFRDAHTSWSEWGKYMTSIYDKRKKEIEDSERPEDESMDLMGAMIRTSGQIPGTANHGKTEAGLSKSEILGNSFVLFLAGHETTANTIHFSMIYLAMRPQSQRKLQADIDELLQGRDPSEWDYDKDLPKLFSGMPAAVMNEELRLIPPITTIPKSTAPGAPQQLVVDGKEVTVPGGAFVGLISTGVHRNPKLWPHEKNDSELGTDLDDFVPERWYNPDAATNTTGASASSVQPECEFSKVSNDGLGVDESADTAATFIRPAKGAYIPFSEGARACLGRRFAQVEILAALAVIFQKYSVELVADQWASLAEVQAMDETARRAMWDKARADAARKLRDEMATVITIQLRGKPILLRLVPRGQELYNF